MFNKKLISLVLIFILTVVFVFPVSALDNSDLLQSLTISHRSKPMSITKEEINNLPNQIKLFLEQNKDKQLLDTIIYHYRVEDNNGEINKELVNTFDIKNYKDFKMFSEYKSLDNHPNLSPRKGRDLYLGISTYSSNSSKPTAYQVQGWWEWDGAALGVFHSNWGVIGLTFYGETLGYSYNCYANGVNTGVTLYPELQDSNDNGCAFQHTSETLSEGAVLGKVVSSNSNSNEEFEVSFTYEYFGENPSQSYLSKLVEFLIGIRFSKPPVPSGNKSFPISKDLYYGNN